MKFTVSILLTLIQFGLLGQPSEWNQGTVKKNKIKEVLVYRKGTNPDYYKDPSGLRLVSETTFDKLGRVTKDNCKGCYQVTDTDGDCCADIKRTFHYDREKLIRIEGMDFPKSTTLFLYNNVNKNRLAIGLDRDDKRNKTKLEYFDQEGREITTIEADFGSSYFKGDTVYQVFISKTISTYDKLSQMREELFGCLYDNLGKAKLEVLASSTSFNEIESVFKTLDLSFLEPNGRYVVYYNDKREEIKKEERNHQDSVLRTYEYARTKMGLIDKELIGSSNYSFENLYKYKFWN